MWPLNCCSSTIPRLCYLVSCYWNVPDNILISNHRDYYNSHQLFFQEWFLLHTAACILRNVAIQWDKTSSKTCVRDKYDRTEGFRWASVRSIAESRKRMSSKFRPNSNNHIVWSEGKRLMKIFQVPCFFDKIQMHSALSKNELSSTWTECTLLLRKLVWLTQLKGDPMSILKYRKR